LWDSKLSGKKKLAVNDEVIVQNNNSIAIFNYSFKIEPYYFNLVQLSDTEFDLKINDIFYKEIMKEEEEGNLQKRKMEKKKGINRMKSKENEDDVKLDESYDIRYKDNNIDNSVRESFNYENENESKEDLID